MSQQFFEEPRVLQEEHKGPSLAFGLCTGLAMALFGLVLNVTRTSPGSPVNYIVLLIFLAGIILFCFRYAKLNNHQVTFKSVFRAAFRMVAAATLVMIAWSVLSAFLFPEMKEEALRASREQALKTGTPAAELEQSMAMARKYYTVFTTMVVLFSNLFYGVVFSLIGAAVTPKNKS